MFFAPFLFCFVYFCFVWTHHALFKRLIRPPRWSCHLLRNSQRCLGLAATVSCLGANKTLVLTSPGLSLKMLRMRCINNPLHVAVSQGSPSRIQVLLCKMHSQCPVPHHPSGQGDIPLLSHGSQRQHHAAHQHECSQRTRKRQQGKVGWEIVAAISTERTDMTK